MVPESVKKKETDKQIAIVVYHHSYLLSTTKNLWYWWYPVRLTCTSTSTQYDRRSFSVAASELWNSLPLHVKNSKTKDNGAIQIILKGVLHPRPILWLFVYFSQKLQHTGDK